MWQIVRFRKIDLRYMWQIVRGQELLEGTKSKVWGHLREGKCHI